MRERDRLRRRRFTEFFKTVLKGDRKLLRTKAGISNGRVSQLLDDNEPFGEEAAANLTRAFKLPADYFDRIEEPTSAAGGVAKMGDAAAASKPAQSPVLELAAEIDGMEFTKDAIALVRAWMALPINKRNAYKRQIETESLQYQDPVPNERIPSAYGNPNAQVTTAAPVADVRTSAGRDTKPKTTKPRKGRGGGESGTQ